MALQRSINTRVPGIESGLLLRENTMMLFADARSTPAGLANALMQQ